MTNQNADLVYVRSMYLEGYDFEGSIVKDYSQVVGVS